MITIFSDIKIFEDILSNSKSFKDDRFVIVDDSGYIIYDNNDIYNIAKNINIDNIDIKKLSTKNLNAVKLNFSINNQNYICMNSKINSTDWTLLRIIPENTLYSDIEIFKSITMVLIIIFILLSMFIVYKLFKKVTNPVSKLIMTMNEVEKGNLNIRFISKHKDEIGLLADNFNNMLQKYRNY